MSRAHCSEGNGPRSSNSEAALFRMTSRRAAYFCSACCSPDRRYDRLQSLLKSIASGPRFQISPICRYSMLRPSLNFRRAEIGQINRQTISPQRMPAVTAKKRWRTISPIIGVVPPSSSSSSSTACDRL